MPAARCAGNSRPEGGLRPWGQFRCRSWQSPLPDRTKRGRSSPSTPGDKNARSPMLRSHSRCGFCGSYRRARAPCLSKTPAIRPFCEEPHRQANRSHSRGRLGGKPRCPKTPRGDAQHSPPLRANATTPPQTARGRGCCGHSHWLTPLQGRGPPNRSRSNRCPRPNCTTLRRSGVAVRVGLSWRKRPRV